MLQTLERPDSLERDTTAPPEVSTPVEMTEVTQPDDGLIATAGPMMAMLYGLAFIAAVLTFLGTVEAEFVVVVSIGIAAMIFTLTLVLMHVRARHDTRWRPADPAHTGDLVDTFTGPIGRGSAVVHVLLVPMAVCVLFVGFGLIWTFVRP